MITFIIALIVGNLLSYLWGFVRGLKTERPEFILGELNNLVPDNHLFFVNKQKFAALPSHREKEAEKLAREGIPSIQDILKERE